jgi:hypothetical protein
VGQELDLLRVFLRSAIRMCNKLHLQKLSTIHDVQQKRPDRDGQGVVAQSAR